MMAIISTTFCHPVFALYWMQTIRLTTFLNRGNTAVLERRPNLQMKNPVRIFCIGIKLDRCSWGSQSCHCESGSIIENIGSGLARSAIVMMVRHPA